MRRRVSKGIEPLNRMNRHIRHDKLYTERSPIARLDKIVPPQNSN